MNKPDSNFASSAKPWTRPVLLAHGTIQEITATTVNSCYDDGDGDPSAPVFCDMGPGNGFRDAV